MRLDRLIAMLVLSACILVAQQPNNANHSMTINAVDGPPFPILTNNVRTNLPAVFSIGGFPNQPYAIFQGNLGVGTTIVVNGIVDLALTPFPVLVIDGFQNPQFTTDPTGYGTLSVQVPGVGTLPTGVPLGLQLTLQSLMGDPLNAPWGVALTAATRITVVQGPIVTLYTLGDEASQPYSLTSMPIPFYGVNQTQVHMCSNGYITFGTASVDYTPTASEMDQGPPRIAPMWTDLTCGSQEVKTTFDVNPGNGNAGYLKIEYSNVEASYNPGIFHNFSLTMKSDGNVEIHSLTTNNASVYDSITGFGPGNSVGLPQTQKNFIGAQPPGSSVGPGILTTPPWYSMVGTVNMSFYEWFGYTNGSTPYYGNPYPNPFDIFGPIIHGQPSGGGNPPANTTIYTIW